MYIDLRAGRDSQLDPFAVRAYFECSGGFFPLTARIEPGEPFGNFAVMTFRVGHSPAVAVEVHRLRRGCHGSVRALNDIDFIAESFEAIPESLADDFLFRHIHPGDPPNRMMLQFIDAETALRIDVFRACGSMMRRTTNLDLSTGMIQLISLEDLTARTARLALDLADGTPTPSKPAGDFLRLAELVTEAETAWLDHRKLGQPTSFQKAGSLLQCLIRARQNLLFTPDYHKDSVNVCSRCESVRALRLADPKVILSILGYS